MSLGARGKLEKNSPKWKKEQGSFRAVVGLYSHAISELKDTWEIVLSCPDSKWTCISFCHERTENCCEPISGFNVSVECATAAEILTKPEDELSLCDKIGFME